MPNAVRYEELRERWLADPEVREAYEDLEPAYQVIRLRTIRGLTQKELADLVGTTQSSIARLESGSQPPSWRFLRKVIEAMGGHLMLKVELNEEAQAAQSCA